jgi:hypothetical protein
MGYQQRKHGIAAASLPKEHAALCVKYPPIFACITQTPFGTDGKWLNYHSDYDELRK